MADEPNGTTPSTPPAGTDAGASGGSSSGHLNALIGAPAPAEPTPSTPTAAPTGAEPATPGPTAPTGTELSAPVTPAPKKWKVRGREYTMAELETAGLIDDLVTTHEQFPHMQKKYTDLLEDKRQTPPAAAPPPQTPAVSPHQFQAQLRAEYTPEMSQVVQNGFLEQDFVELYPNAVAQMLWHRDGLRQAIATIAQLQETVSSLTGRNVATDHRGELDKKLDDVAGRDKVFEGLKDPEQRKAFMDYLIDVDPFVDKITPDFLAKQWIAFTSEAILAASKQAGDVQRQADEAARRRAVGAGSGVRPGTPVPQPKTHFDAFIDGALSR